MWETLMFGDGGAWSKGMMWVGVAAASSERAAGAPLGEFSVGRALDQGELMALWHRKGFGWWCCFAAGLGVRFAVDVARFAGRGRNLRAGVSISR